MVVKMQGRQDILVDDSIHSAEISIVQVGWAAVNKRKKHGQGMLESTFIKSCEVWFWISFYLSIIIFLSMLLSMPTSLIPLHNAIKFPAYWWEVIIHAALGYTLYEVLNTIVECRMVFNFDFLTSIGFFLRFYTLNLLSLLVSSCTCYLVWTLWLGFNHPIPFLGIIGYIFSNLTHFVSLWFQFPYHLRNKEVARRMFVAYILYRLWSLFYSNQLLGIKMIMDKLPLEIQWIMSVILPINRELNLLVFIKLLKKCIDPKTTVFLVPKLAATIVVNNSHAFSIAMIFSSTTKTTCYCILAVDFVLNLIMSYKIIRLYRNISPIDRSENEGSILEKTEETLQLFAIEAIEFLVPIVYSITFVIAYYGPNAELIGNIRNNDWNFQSVDDIASFLGDMFLMFFIDFTSCIISGFALWKFSSTSFFREGYKMLKNFWPFVSIKMGGMIVMVVTLNYALLIFRY